YGAPVSSSSLSSSLLSSASAAAAASSSSSSSFRNTIKKMNAGFLPGSAFRGRVLLSAGVTDPEKKKSSGGVGVGSGPITKAQIGGVAALRGAQRPVEEKYTLRVDLYEASEVPMRGFFLWPLWCLSRMD